MKIPLIIIKALVSDNWFNENEDPGRMSIFFISSNSLLEDEESLFLSLKLAEGKDFLDKAIWSLLKKEYHILTSPLELKEQLHYITVFHSLFNSLGKSTKEIKKVFDMVFKREWLVRLLFNKVVVFFLNKKY